VKKTFSQECKNLLPSDTDIYDGKKKIDKIDIIEKSENRQKKELPKKIGDYKISKDIIAQNISYDKLKLTSFCLYK